MQLFKHQAGTTDSGSGVRTEDPAKSILTACIVSHSILASQYLLLVLTQAPNIRSARLDEFIRNPADPKSTVFIFDASSLSLPLGECMRRLQIRFSGARYLVIDKTQTSRQIVRLLLLGVHGYLNDCTVAQELADAARTVVGGKLWVTDAVLQEYVLFTTRSTQTNVPKAHTPTCREIQILELVQQRFSNKEIAQMFNIRESTVKFHLTNIFGKLQVLNRRELVDRESPPDVWAGLLEHRVSAMNLPADSLNNLKSQTYV